MLSALRSIIAFLVVAVAPLASAQGSVYRVSGDDLLCVRRNLQEYTRQPGDIVVIVVAECRRTGRSAPEDSNRTLSFSMVDEEADVDTTGPATADGVMSFPRSEMACLRDFLGGLEIEVDNVYEIPTQPCDSG